MTARRPPRRPQRERPAGSTHLKRSQSQTLQDRMCSCRSCDSAAVSALCCNVHRRHLAPSKYEFVARCAFSCRPLGHIQVACPPVPFRFSVLVTFRAYLDYFGFRSGHSAVTRTGTTGIACPPVPLFGARYIFSCLPRFFLFSVTRNHWHSMSAVPLFGARYTFW